MNNRMEFLDTGEKKKQFYFTYGAFLINGMLALSIGSLLPFIKDAKMLSYAFGGFIVSLHSVGNLISSFAGGTLPVFIGRKKTILLFNLFTAVAYAMIVFGNDKYTIAAAFFLTGLSRGATSNFCNTVINNLAPGKAWTINALHATFAVGAFLFPILIILLTNNNPDNWGYACVFMVIMGVISWLLYFFTPLSNDRLEKKQGNQGGFLFFKEPLFWICTGTLFFYLCGEQGVIGWMITYFKDTGLLSATLSQITASVLWIMILAGRLSAAWLSTRVKKEKLLVIMGVGLTLFFFILLFSRTTAVIFIAIMGFGYSMAGIYPTTVAVGGKIIKKYDMAWSFMLTMASLGAIVMPSIIGKIAETAGIFYGMSSIVAVVFIDLAFIIGLYLLQGKKENA